MLNGFDVSNWQNSMNAGTLPGDFAIMKATEGTSYVNPSCDTHYQQAKKAGKLLGVYHFASGSDAVKEADYFVSNVKGYVGEALLVLDWEADAVKKGASWALNWLWRVHDKTGVWPLIYMSQSVCTAYDWAEVAKNCGLWVAKYPSSSKMGYEAYPSGMSFGTGAWRSCAIWQYTSNGYLNGSGPLDLNHAYMTRDAWKKYAGAAEAGGAPAPSVLENDRYRITVEEK